MSRRFFAETPIQAEIVKLTGAEAHHLIHVMRAQPNDRVILFDGSGSEFIAQVQDVGRKEVQLHIESCQQPNRELPYPLILAVALPRGDRQDWLIEKAVELGVTRIVPWQTQRSVARPNAKSLERLRRTVIEACKQCGRNRLMEIVPVCEFADFLQHATERPSLLAHVCATGPGCRLPALLADAGADGVQFGIGPEGGFTDQEVEQAIAAGWHPVSFGPRILRTETAAVALASMVALTCTAS